MVKSSSTATTVSSSSSPQNMMAVATTISSTTTATTTTTTTMNKSNLVDHSKKLSSSLSSTTTRLTPSPSSWRHFFYILGIYRYVLLCLLFGCMSLIIGVALFLLGILFRSNTTSIHLIESVPLYMPSLILFCNGLSLVAFMNKNTRRLYLLKSVCGLYLLVTLLMIIIAITTSAIHLPRLHLHRECAYNVRIRACTCVLSHQQQQHLISIQNSNNIDDDNDDDGDADIPLSNPFRGNHLIEDYNDELILYLFVYLASSKHFTMEEIMNCDLIHGIIYDSLRVVFALSLLAIAISIFSMITLFQLSTHEKRKLCFNNQLAMARDHHRRQYQQAQQIHHSSRSHSPPVNHRSLTSDDDCLPTSMTTTATITAKQQTSTNQFCHPSLPTDFKCLSADFSSQDLLIDNHQNSIHQTFKSPTTISNTPGDDPELLLFSPTRKLEPQDKIWSSSHSTTNFAIPDIEQYQSSDKNDHQQSSGSNLRRYMSVILDTPSNVHSYVWRKLNSLKNIQKHNSTRDDMHTKFSQQQRKHHHLLPPPHISIPRFSVSQLSNMKTDNSKKSQSILQTASSSSSSSYSNASSSSLGSSSFIKNQTIRYQLNTANNVELLLPKESQLIFSQNSSVDLESGHQCLFEPNESLFNNVEQSRTDFTSKYSQSLQSDNSISKNESNDHSKWSKCLTNLANSFECIDEDEELAKGFVQPPTSTAQSTTTQPYISYFNPFESTSIIYDRSSIKEQSTLDNHPSDNEHHLFRLMDAENNRHQQNTQPNQQPSLVDVFTFASSGNSTEYHHQIYTTFEEAFKNYYDSQNRISNNYSNYYTLPLNKTNGHTAKDSRHRYHRQRNGGQSDRIVNGRQHRKNYSPSSQNAIGMSNPSAKQMAKHQESSPIVVNNHTEFTEEIPFHVAIIEPPEDYQNLFPSNKQQPEARETKKQQKVQSQTIDSNDLIQTNQLLPHPYRYWLEQMNQPKLDQILNDDKINNPAFIGDDDDDDNDDDSCEDLENGDDDDEDDDDDEADGAGDTSTSQDIADFELELDEEPIKFVSEDDFKILVSNPSLKKLEDLFRSVDLGTINSVHHNQNEDKNQNNTIITRLPNTNQIPKPSETMNVPETILVEPLPIVETAAAVKSPIDLLEMNMNLLKRRVQEQMLNINNQNKNDCGFDGFRKGCFGDGDDNDDSSDTSTTGTASSLSSTCGDEQVNQDEESTDEEHSITAEYIKPPTPFTNYLFES
ncbi:uncharacterized protein LOC124499981 isoform X3 [Dermatophagoides farinae]|uniref:uncharacterized protein LOC124499981 isoform X3 n=1 Tax=Dermatophagoides farinae TaxID=6954 RepID=UPI003F5FFF24